MSDDLTELANECAKPIGLKDISECIGTEPYHLDLDQLYSAVRTASRQHAAEDEYNTLSIIVTLKNEVKQLFIAFPDTYYMYGEFPIDDFQTLYKITCVSQATGPISAPDPNFHDEALCRVLVLSHIANMLCVNAQILHTPFMGIVFHTFRILKERHPPKFNSKARDLIWIAKGDAAAEHPDLIITHSGWLNDKPEVPTQSPVAASGSTYLSPFVTGGGWGATLRS